MAGKLAAPPTSNVAEADIVKFPPVELLDAVRLPMSSVPPDKVISPLTDRLPERVQVPEVLLTTKLLKVDADIVWLPEPLNWTVPDPGVKLPLLVQLPPTRVVVLLPLSVPPALTETSPETVRPALRFSVPPVIDRLPVMVVAALEVTPPLLLFIVRLL